MRERNSAEAKPRWRGHSRQETVREAHSYAEDTTPPLGLTALCSSPSSPFPREGPLPMGVRAQTAQLQGTPLTENTM